MLINLYALFLSRTFPLRGRPCLVFFSSLIELWELETFVFSPNVVGIIEVCFFWGAPVGLDVVKLGRIGLNLLKDDTQNCF